jgi:hypothetical protein
MEIFLLSCRPVIDSYISYADLLNIVLHMIISLTKNSYKILRSPASRRRALEIYTIHDIITSGGHEDLSPFM